jgi:hypothetical protein
VTDPTGTDAAGPITVFIASTASRGGGMGEDPTGTDAAPPATRVAVSAAAGVAAGPGTDGDGA